MQEENPRSIKGALREEFLRKRKSLSMQRRDAARERCCERLLPLLEPHPLVLSFASLPEEIDLWRLNAFLAQKGKLLLPKIAEGEIHIYQVHDLHLDLKRFSWDLLEPIPERCTLIPLERVTCILVPGLAFDKELMRLGYGKGFYDRLLHACKGHKIGVGFQEQISDFALPIEPHDQKLHGVELF